MHTCLFFFQCSCLLKFESVVVSSFPLPSSVHLTLTILPSVLLFSSPGCPGCSQLTALVTFKARLAVLGSRSAMRGMCTCSNVFFFVCVCRGDGGRLKINAVQGHECRFACACTCDTVISELNFTPCGFAIVRPRGTVDGQQGEDKARNLHRIKKGRGGWQREGESVHTPREDECQRWERRWWGRTDEQYKTEQNNSEGYTILQKSNMNCDWIFPR